MSEKKIIDYLQAPRSITIGTRFLRPVIISDSKGVYLKHQIRHPEDRQLVWWNKSGTTIERELHWLGEHIHDKIRELGDIHLYIWLGTCNLTKKNKDGTISLTSQQPNAAINIFTKLIKFQELLVPYPNCRTTIVEIPYYSITNWNTKVKGQRSDDRLNQDRELHAQIDQLNESIHQFNDSNSVQSPLLNLHTKASKQVKRGRNKPRKKYTNYQLYADGIHPKHLLAKAWLAEFSQRIRKDCWH